jgi:2-methylcitrate dehydratase PrpD
MINYIEAYYSLLKTDKEKDDISNIKIGTETWCDKIINLLYDYKKKEENKKLNDEGIVK